MEQMSDLEIEIRDTMKWLSNEPYDINRNVVAVTICNLMSYVRSATNDEYDAAFKQLVDLIWE